MLLIYAGILTVPLDEARERLAEYAEVSMLKTQPVV